MDDFQRTWNIPALGETFEIRGSSKVSSAALESSNMEVEIPLSELPPGVAYYAPPPPREPSKNTKTPVSLKNNSKGGKKEQSEKENPERRTERGGSGGGRRNSKGKEIAQKSGDGSGNGSRARWVLTVVGLG